MFKKFISAFLVLTFIICSFSACSDKEINIIYPIAADPDCLDPQIAESEEAVLVTRNCMEGLVRLGADGEILPGVAESWDISADGRTYVFNIRSDAMWQKLNSHSDVLGEDFEDTFDYSVTAADCAFGIIRALRPETKAKNAYMLYCIKNAMSFNNGAAQENELGISASGNKLTITLERANPDFIRILTYPMCMPCNKKFFEATGAKYGLELKYTLCNGPFYVGNWVEDSTVTLYKSETYAGEGKTSVSAIYFNVNSDASQIVTKFNQGDYNASPVEKSYAQEIKNADDVVFAERKNIVSGLAFNTKDIFLSNNDLRKALICATDMSVLDDKKEYAGGVVPASCRWGGSSYRGCAGAAEKPEISSENAVKYFFDGLKQLGQTKADLCILCTEKTRDDIVRLIQNWQKLFGFSITVTTKVMEQKEIDEAVSKNEYQIALVSLEAQDGNPLEFLQYFCTDGENNVFSFSDANYDMLIQRCLYTYEGDQILSGIKTAEQYIISNGIFYPLYNGTTQFVYRSELNGIYAVSSVKDIDFGMRVNGNEK